MLELAILRGEARQLDVPKSLYYDEKIVVQVKSVGTASSVRFQAKFVAHADTAPNQSDLEFVTVHEETFVAHGNDLWESQIHLRRPHFDKQVANVQLELVAVAITDQEPSKRPRPVVDLHSLQPIHQDTLFGPLLQSLDMDGPEPQPAAPLAGDGDCPGPAGPSSPNGLAGTQKDTANGRTRGHSRHQSVHTSEPQEEEKAFWQLPMLPSLQLKLRTVRPVLERDRLVAQLSLTTPPDLHVGLEMDRVSLKLMNATTDEMGATQLPLQLAAGGLFTQSYNLQTISTTQSRRTATVNVKHCVLEECRPTIETMWHTEVDFDEIKGPLPKTPMLGIPSPAPRHGSMASLASRPGGSSVGPPSDIDEMSVRSVRTPLGGVSIFFAGPNRVKLNDEFEWQVYVSNKSSRARKISIYFHSKDNPLPPIMPYRNEERPLVSDLYALRYRAAQQASLLGTERGIVTLTNELRVGTLAGQSCFKSSVKLKALARGTHSIWGSTVVDISSGDLYDTGELLSVIVE